MYTHTRTQTNYFRTSLHSKIETANAMGKSTRRRRVLQFLHTSLRFETILSSSKRVRTCCRTPILPFLNSYRVALCSPCSCFTPPQRSKLRFCERCPATFRWATPSGNYALAGSAAFCCRWAFQMWPDAANRAKETQQIPSEKALRQIPRINAFSK